VADAPHGLAARVKIVITQPVNGPLMTSLLPTNGVSAIAPVAYGRTYTSDAASAAVGFLHSAKSRTNPAAPLTCR